MNTELNEDVPVPETKRPRKPRAPANRTRARKAIANPAKPANPAAGLIAALKFISVAQKKIGEIQSQYCMITGGWIAAASESFMIACKVQEDLNACPHTLQFLEALLNCSEELSIAQVSESLLSVKSGAFTGIVPCVPFSALSLTAPDAPCATIDDRVRVAIGNVCTVATEGAVNAAFGSVLLQRDSAVATNGFAMLESWHGNDLPPAMLVPKQAALAIAKCGKTLTKFGYSGATATFYFEDESFIKVNLTQERYPNYSEVLDVLDLQFWALPENFFQAVGIIEKFSEDGVVYLSKEGVFSGTNAELSSVYKVEGLLEEMSFPAKSLLQLKEHFGKADFSKGNRVFFVKDATRGVLAAMSKSNYNPVPKTN